MVELLTGEIALQSIMRVYILYLFVRAFYPLAGGARYARNKAL